MSNDICPISYERYKHPVILPLCGHTLDKFSIDKMVKYECPLCKTEFHPNTVQTNWALVSLLDLSVSNIENENLIDAVYLRKLSEKILEIKVNNLIKDVNEKLIEQVGQGSNSMIYTIHYNNELCFELLKKFINKLKQKKYHIQTQVVESMSLVNIYICWFCNKFCKKDDYDIDNYFD